MKRIDAVFPLRSSSIHGPIVRITTNQQPLIFQINRIDTAESDESLGEKYTVQIIDELNSTAYDGITHR